jgi:hypothetical protein
MAIQSGGTTSTTFGLPSNPAIPDIHQQGIVAGVFGAATVALWFFLVDVVSGRPFFYTPNVLGTALFRGGAGLDQPQVLAVSFEMVLVYTWVHGLIFCAIGGLAAKLLALAERDVHAGFGVLLLFVIFEFGFVGGASIFAEPILHALAWPTVLVGNLLAAAVMTAYFWRWHPDLRIDP